MILSEIIEVAATLIEHSLLYVFIGMFNLPYRDSKYINPKVKILIAVAFTTTLVLLVNRFVDLVTITAIITAMICWAFCVFWIYDCQFFSTKRNSALTMALVFTLLFLIEELLLTTLILSFSSETSFAAFTEKGSTVRNLYIVILKSANILWFVGIRIKFKLEYLEHIQYRSVIVWMLLFACASIWGFNNVMIENREIDTEMVVFVLVILLFACFTLVSFVRYANKTYEAERYKLIAMNNTLLTKHATEVEALVSQIQGIYHDSSNHIRTIELLLTEDRELAIPYFDKLKAELKKVDYIIRTGSKPLDLVIYSKCRLAEDESIQFSVFAEKSTLLETFDSFDITTIASNLIDNSIEACKRYPDKEQVIDLYVTVKKGALIMNISNPAEPEDRVWCEKNISSKTENTGSHGFGLKMVRNAVEKYSGAICYAYDQGKLTTTVTLFIPSPGRTHTIEEAPSPIASNISK